MRKKPETIVQAQFSIPYTVATALRKGSVGLADFTDEGIRDPGSRATAALIDVAVDPEIEREWSRNISPTRLGVETDAGNFEARFDQPRGDANAPMSRADFDAKLRGCLEISGLDWPADAVERLRTAVDDLESARDVGALVRCMTALD